MLLVFQSQFPVIQVDVVKGKLHQLQLVADEGVWNPEGSHLAVRTPIGWQQMPWPIGNDTVHGIWVAPADERLLFLDNETLLTAGRRGIHQRDMTGRIQATSPQSNEVGVDSIWAHMPPDSGLWSPASRSGGRGLWATQRAPRHHGLQSHCLKVDMPAEILCWSLDKEGRRLSFLASDTLHILTLPLGVQAYGRHPCMPLGAMAFGGADADHLMLASEDMLIALDLASEQIDDEIEWAPATGKVFMEWNSATRILVVARLGKVSLWSFD